MCSRVSQIYYWRSSFRKMLVRSSFIMRWLCVMLLGAKWAALVTAQRSPRVLATKMGKLSDWSYANPCKECIALGRRYESRGPRFKFWCQQNNFFSWNLNFRGPSISRTHCFCNYKTPFWKRFTQHDGGSVGWGTQKLKGFMRMWGSIAQRLACLLPDSAALGSTPSIPKKISEEKMSMMLRLIKGAG